RPGDPGAVWRHEGDGCTFALGSTGGAARRVWAPRNLPRGAVGGPIGLLLGAPAEEGNCHQVTRLLRAAGAIHRISFHCGPRRLGSNQGVSPSEGGTPSL